MSTERNRPDQILDQAIAEIRAEELDVAAVIRQTVRRCPLRNLFN